MSRPKNRINWAKKRAGGNGPLASLLLAVSRRHPLWSKRKVARVAARQIKENREIK